MANWIRYLADGVEGFGTLEGTRIAEYRGALFGEKSATGRTFELGGVQLLCPCEPSKVVALWNNFHALGAKLGKAAPVHPLFLIKPGSSAIGSGAAIRRPARYAGKIAFEGELGIVIGRRCREVTPEEADAYIFGYTCVNDVTSAQLLDEDPNFAQWTRAKGSDTYSCIGPGIASTLDWRSAHVVTTVDDGERQNYPLADMIFTPQQIVAAISGDMSLLPGDVIACGTSLGVGSMKDGATVCVRIEGIGELRNRLGA